MAPPNPRADWERLGDRFYQKVRIYDGIFDEDLELENYVVAAAPYAGALGIAPIAPFFVKDTNSMVLLKRSIEVKVRFIGIGMRKQPKRV